MPKSWDVWRILREVDLEAVRAEAELPFRVQVLAENERDAVALSAILSGSGDGSHHPSLLPGAATLGALPRPTPDLAVAVSRGAELAPRLALATETLSRARVPIATVVVGGNLPDGVVRPGEAARAAIPSLDRRYAGAVAQALVSAAPSRLRLALARQLPPLRPPLMAAIVEQTARANALYALGTGVAEAVPLLTLPLNVADIFVLTKNQLVMSYRIALAGGRSGSVRAVLGQTIGVVGSGFLLRQLARQLVGLVPVIGIAPKVAVAYAGTWAVGRAVAAWANGGPEVSARAVKHFYAEALERGRRVSASLVSRARRGRGRK
jgi:uncharacterized protein (DUF697 family)